MSQWLCLAWISLLVAPAFAQDHLTVISPHRKSLQDEFVPLFEEYYKATYKRDIDVEWLDQGGSESNLRFVRTRYSSNPSSSKIDVFWGGGDMTFVELENDGLLEAFELPAPLKVELPAKVVGIDLRSPHSRWYATALSSFGIFFNKKLLTHQKLNTPQTWSDLADPSLIENLSIADPRKSSSALLMNIIILKALGWEKGWLSLAGIAGNTKKFTHSSSDPIKAVVSGDATAATAIDFYAIEKVASLGEDNLGYTLPQGATVFNSDPVGILKGAPNRKVAEAFVEFLLLAKSQKILFMPKGSPSGPKSSDLGRMAINSKAYEEAAKEGFMGINPFKMSPNQMKLDMNEISQIKTVISDLIGAIHVDTHRDLKKAWKAMSARKNFQEELKVFGLPPIKEGDLMVLAKKWDDGVFRNKTINEWVKWAQDNYEVILARNS